MCVHTRQELWAFVSIFQGPCGVYSICDMWVPFLPLLTIPSHQEWPIMSRITEINQDLSLSSATATAAQHPTQISRDRKDIYPSIHLLLASGILASAGLSSSLSLPSSIDVHISCILLLLLPYWFSDTHVVDLVRFYRRQQAAATALDYLRHISFFRPTRCSSSPLQKMIDGTLVAVININQDWWWCGDLSGKQIEVWIWLRSTTYL